MTTETAVKQEMVIPKSKGETNFYFIVTCIVIATVKFAIENILNGIALIPSFIGLALIAFLIWKACIEQRGLFIFIANRLGELIGQYFAEIPVQDGQRKEIRFGYKLFGLRFYQQSIPLEKIESIEWDKGQVSSMAGRDMNDWQVFLWFDHDDLVESEKRRRWNYRKPDQEIYMVGPSTRKKKTERLGLSLIAFLRAAGVTLIQDKTNCFVRTQHEMVIE